MAMRFRTSVRAMEPSAVRSISEFQISNRKSNIVTERLWFLVLLNLSWPELMPRLAEFTTEAGRTAIMKRVLRLRRMLFFYRSIVSDVTSTGCGHRRFWAAFAASH